MDQYQTRQSFNYPGRSFSHSPIEQNYPRNYSSMGSENGYNEKHDMSSKDVYPTNKLERKIQSEARKASSIKRGDSNQLGITPVYWNDQMSRPLSMVSKSDIGFSGDGEVSVSIIKFYKKNYQFNSFGGNFLFIFKKSRKTAR